MGIPNGKRYARRSADGEIARAFGFDLRPLLHNAAVIAKAAKQARADRAHLAAACEKLSLLKRNALKLALYSPENVLSLIPLALILKAYPIVSRTRGIGAI